MALKASECVAKSRELSTLVEMRSGFRIPGRSANKTFRNYSRCVSYERWVNKTSLQQFQTKCLDFWVYVIIFKKEDCFATSSTSDNDDDSQCFDI